MDEKLIVTNTHESGLTQTVRARYARYMPVADVLPKEETPVIVDGVERKPGLAVLPTAGKPAEHHVVHVNNHGAKTGFQELVHGDSVRAVSETEKSVNEHTDVKKESEEALKKPDNILKALWNALLQAFKKDSNLEEKGFQDALSLSIVFSDAVSASPLTAWDEDKLKTGYLNWYKLSQTYDKDPSVQVVAKAGLQEVRLAVKSKNDADKSNIDLEAFEAKVKGYYLENKEHITLDSLKKRALDTEASKAEEAKKQAYFKEQLAHRVLILPGEIFSPSLELKEIMKKPHAEREIALPLFKEKLEYQKIGLTNLRESLLTKLSTQPEMTQADVDKEIMAYANVCGFDNNQLADIAGITDRFLAKRDQVAALKKQHIDEQTGELNATTLFKAVMGYEPTTKVEAVMGPVSVCFIVKDTAEFKKAVKEEKPIGDEAKGRIIAHVEGDPTLDNMVLVVSTDDPGIITHEIQHSINEPFLRLVDQAAGDKSSLEERLQKAKDDEERRIIVNSHVRRVRDLRLVGMQDEIFAFTKQGMKGEAIKHILTGENSNYGIDRTTELALLVANDPKHADLLEASFTHVFSEYEGIVVKGIDALQQLFDRKDANGFHVYTKEQAIGLLSTTPMKDWNKVVNRLLEQTPHAAADVRLSAKEGFDRLHAVRTENAEKDLKIDEDSALEKNRKFIMPTVIPLAPTDKIPMSDEVIEKIEPRGYTDITIRGYVNDIIDKAGEPNGLTFADLIAIRGHLNGYPSPGLKEQQEKKEALRILADAEKRASKVRKEDYAKPRQEMLLSQDEPHSVELKYQSALDLIRFYGSEIFQRDASTWSRGDREELLQPRIGEPNPYSGKITQTGSVMTWIGELQKIIWDIERNIANGSLKANDTQKKIIKEFSDEDFDQYTADTPDKFEKLQKLLNNLLSDSQNDIDKTWAETGARGMDIDPVTGKIKSAKAKFLGIEATELFGDVVTQKRKRLTKKRSMQEAYELPPSFQDVVEQVISAQAPPEYRSGGPFEVIDRKGNPQFANIERYIRRLIILQHQANPKDSINLFSDVAFPGLISLSLGQLTDPKLQQFRVTNYLEIKGNLDAAPADREFKIEKGTHNEPKTRGDDPEVKNFLDKMRSFAYNFSQIHNYSVIYTDNQAKSPSELGKMIGQIHHKNEYIDSLQIYFKMVETNVDSKDFTKKLIDNDEGGVGNAMRMALFLYKHIDELADNTRKSGESTESYFKRNMFYRTLTNDLKHLGGLDDFFFTIAGEAIAGNANSDSRKLYKDLVRKQLEAQNAGATEEEKRLITAKVEEVSNDPLYGIRIDTNIALADVLARQYKRSPAAHGLSASATDSEIRLKADQDARQRMYDAMTQDDPPGSGKIYLEQLVQLDKLYKDGSEADKRKKLEAEYSTFWLRDPNNTDLEKYAGLEKYAFSFLSLLDETVKKYGREDLNIFDAVGKAEVITRSMRAAIRNSVGTIYNLNDTDKTLAEEVIFSFSKPIFNGFAAADKNANAFDGSSKFINEYDYLQRTMSGRGGIANPLGMRNIMHGVIPFTDFIKVNVTDDKGNIQRETLSEWLRGGQGEAGSMDLTSKLKSWAGGGIASNAAQGWGEIYVSNSAELFEDREANVMNLDNIIKQDIRGNYHIDTQAGQKLLKDRWKKIRYSLGGTGGNEFHDDPDDKSQQLRVRKRTKDKDGKTVFEFDWEPRANYVYGKPVREMWEKARDRRLKKDPTFLKSETAVADEGAKQEYKKEIADMIAIRMEHHYFRDPLFASDIQKFKLFYLDFAKSSFDIDEHGHKVEDTPFFTNADWDDILEAAEIKNVGWWIPFTNGIPGSREFSLELREARRQIGYGLSDGFVKMFKEFFKKIGGEATK